MDGGYVSMLSLGGQPLWRAVHYTLYCTLEHPHAALVSAKYWPHLRGRYESVYFPIKMNAYPDGIAVAPRYRLYAEYPLNL